MNVLLIFDEAGKYKLYKSQIENFVNNARPNDYFNMLFSQIIGVAFGQYDEYTKDIFALYGSFVAKRLEKWYNIYRRQEHRGFLPPFARRIRYVDRGGTLYYGTGQPAKLPM